MKAPFPWFGGKRRVAPAVWARFGDVQNYVEPFFGSGAVLLDRPGRGAGPIETVNDLDGFVANFFRALQAAPAEVARHADWPVNEADLFARHIWLVQHREELTARLMGDPDYCDAKIAGWWCWGLACWIGSGFCSGDGPWSSVDGQLVHLGDAGQGRGVHRKRVHLGNAGRGVNRQLVHLSNAGQGVNRQLVHLGDAGQGDASNGEQGLLAWMQSLAARLARVRVCCGDWQRVLGPSVTTLHGATGVLLDPPYSAESGRDTAIYAVDSLDVAHAARAWAVEHGDDPLLRIALCGYDDQEMPSDWTALAWKADGGYGNQGAGAGRANAAREVVWFSPHCLPLERRAQLALDFDEHDQSRDELLHGRRSTLRDPAVHRC